MENQKKFQLQLEKTVNGQQGKNDVTIIDQTKRLDEIPTNSDDIQMALISKGSLT